MIKLRDLKDSDIGYFEKWWRNPELIAVTSGDFKPLADNDVKRYFEQTRAGAAALNFMIEAGGLTIGHISLQRRPNDWWETQIVIGEKSMQGRGYGTEAVKKLIEIAGGRGVSKIYLEVRPENSRAIGAYKKAGFRQIGSEFKTNNPNQPKLIRMEHSPNRASG